MKNIKQIITETYKDEWKRQNTVPLLFGNPGTGKSQMVYQTLKELGSTCYEFITSQRNPTEISGIAMPVHDLQKMSIWDFDMMLNLKDGDTLFFDEILNGNPTTLNACLTLLEQRKMISGRPLPKIMIIAAGNPQGTGQMTPQQKERFIWHDVKFDSNSWIKNYMIPKYEISYSIGIKLSNLITTEGFKLGTYNFCTPRSLDKAVYDVLNGYITPYQNLVLPILEELVQNTTGLTIPLKDRQFLPNEYLKWIDLIKLSDINNTIIKNEIINKS